MAGKLPNRYHTLQPIAKIITDLDQSENDNEEKPEKPPSSTTVGKSHHVHQHRRRNQSKTDSKQFGENLSNRSKSAETKANGIVGVKQKEQKSLNEKHLKLMIRTKDEQIDKLVQRVTELHNYNNQFASEYERLRNDNRLLTENCQTLAKDLQVSELRQCTECVELRQEIDNLQMDNKRLGNDVTMMKTLVYRLNVQIERYQDKCRKASQANKTEKDLNIHCPSELPDPDVIFDWGPVNTHTLGPLLNAYEELLHDKDDLIQQHENEINRFTGNLKEILEENERLQKDMDDLQRGKDGWREERTKLQAHLDVCRGKAEVQTKRADLAKEKLVEVLRCYEQKIQAQALDMDRIQDAYSRTKGELISIKRMNSQPDAIAESFKECQKLFEELKSQHDIEKTKITEEMAELKKQNTELKDSVEKLKEEKLKLKDENKKERGLFEELKSRTILLQRVSEKLKKSRDRLKSRLKVALQWAQKLEEGQKKLNNTWDELKQLEAIVKHKESQIRGLHARHLEEVEKLQTKLQQREETIKTILKERIKTNAL